jgi:Na+/proline symporter
MAFGTRHLDTTERHEGMVAAIAFESVVKLLAFLAVGVFVTWGLFDGLGDLFARVPGRARPAPLLRPAARPFAYDQWFALTAAGHAVGDLPAAPVPGDGGRERGRAPPAPRRLGFPPTCC